MTGGTRYLYVAPFTDVNVGRVFGGFAVVTVVLLVSSACGITPENGTTPDEARDALVSTVENSASLLGIGGWTWDGAPEVGNCGSETGQRVDFTYGYGAPPPDSGHTADAQMIAEYWKSLGMEVRIVEEPLVVVYASGGPVGGLSFSTAPGDYHISGTSSCVPGHADEIRERQT